jgi:hypothetical protein
MLQDGEFLGYLKRSRLINYHAGNQRQGISSVMHKDQSSNYKEHSKPVTPLPHFLACYNLSLIVREIISKSVRTVETCVPHTGAENSQERHMFDSFSPEDGNCKLLRNVGFFQPILMVTQPRRT